MSDGIMRKTLFIIALLSVVSMFAYAQTFSQPTRLDNPTIQSQQLVKSGSGYNGTVYEPFSTAVPSERTGIGASYSPAQAPGGPRKGFLDPSNPGNQSNESPIGDAVLPMLLCAAFYGVIYIRRKRSALNS